MVRQLTVLAYIGRERGLLAMEEEVRDRGRYPDAHQVNPLLGAVDVGHHDIPFLVGVGMGGVVNRDEVPLALHDLGDADTATLDLGYPWR